MKKIFVSAIYFFALSTGLKAQTNKWFASFSTGYCIGGPRTSINNMLIDQGFNQTSNNLFWSGSTSYPVNWPILPIILVAGKQITKYISLYLVIGQPSGGTVKGYEGYNSVNFHYHVLQFSLGYQVSFPDTRFKVGLGPSLFILKNSPEVNYKSFSAQTSTIPGATITARVPFGSEKKLFGVEFFFQLNLASTSNLGGVQITDREIPDSKVSMTNAIIGICFAFRG